MSEREKSVPQNPDAIFSARQTEPLMSGHDIDLVFQVKANMTGMSQLTGKTSHVSAEESAAMLTAILMKTLKKNAVEPPRAGELVLWFACSKEHREAMLGDLAEDFQSCFQRHGRRAAFAWYWWQVCRSVMVSGAGLLLRIVGVKELLSRLGF